MAGIIHVFSMHIQVVSSCFSLLFKIFSFNRFTLAAYSGCLLIYRIIAHRDPFSDLKNRSGETLLPADTVTYLEAVVYTSVCLSMSCSKFSSRSTCPCCIFTMLQTLILSAKTYCDVLMAHWVDLLPVLHLFSHLPPTRGNVMNKTVP